MQKQRVFGLMLAATFAITGLAGCQSPAQTGTPGTSQPASADARDGAAAALAEEREMDDYDFMAGQESAAAGYAVLVVGQPKPREGEVAITGGVDVEASAEARAERREQARAGFTGKLSDAVRQKLMARQAQKAERIKARLEKMKVARDRIREEARAAKWVDNGDGTETKTLSFSVEKTVNGQQATRSVEMSRTRHAETKDLVASSVKFSITTPNGASKASERTKTLNEDGSYTVVYHAERQFKDGTKRVADWTKTVAVDGTVTGTGTIVWTDKDGNEVKKVEVTLKGSDEAPVADAGGETVTPEQAPAAEVEVEAEAAATAEAQPEEPQATEEAEATEASD